MVLKNHKIGNKEDQVLIALGDGDTLIGAAKLANSNINCITIRNSTPREIGALVNVAETGIDLTTADVVISFTNKESLGVLIHQLSNVLIHWDK